MNVIFNFNKINYFLQCDRTVASKESLAQVLNEPKKLALIGSGCSVATEPVAELSSYFNISQVNNGYFGSITFKSHMYS